MIKWIKRRWYRFVHKPPKPLSYEEILERIKATGIRPYSIGLNVTHKETVDRLAAMMDAYQRLTPDERKALNDKIKKEETNE